MPDFKPVLWKTAIRKEFDKKKDPKVILATLETKVVDVALDTAEANHALWASYASKAHADGKKLIELADKAFEFLKSGKSNDEEALVRQIGVVHGKLQTMVRDINQTNETYAACFADDGFRVDDLFAAMGDAGVFDRVPRTELEKEFKPRLKARRQTVIVTDRTVLGDRNRLEEYLERARVIAEAAAEMSGEEKLHKEKFKEHMEEFEAMFAGEQGIDRRLEQLQLKITEALAAATNGPRALAEAKLNLADTELKVVARNLSGQIKTAVTLVQKQKDVYGKKLFAMMTLSKATKRITGVVEQFKKMNAMVEVLPKRMRELMANLPA